MKKVLSILFILFFLLNIIGTLGFYYYQRANIRAEMKSFMKSNIPENKIEIIKVDINSKYFQRIHAKEFRFHGKLYDIIKEVPYKDLTVFYCINDKKEEQLLEDISKIFDTSTDGMTTVKYSGKILKNIFFPFYFESSKKNICDVYSSQKIYITSDKCLTCFYDVEIPPPEIF